MIVIDDSAIRLFTSAGLVFKEASNAIWPEGGNVEGKVRFSRRECIGIEHRIYISGMFIIFLCVYGELI